jgi:hypothetical protein
MVVQAQAMPPTAVPSMPPPVPPPAPLPHEVWTFWGIPSDAWLALATFGLMGATVLLVVVGLIQLRSIRREEQRKRTLEICAQYETNLVLHLCVTRVARARDNGNLEVNPTHYRSYMVGILNYLESVEIGIRQGLYHEGIAFDQLEAIVRGHVARYIDSGLIQRAGSDPQNFRRVVAMRDRWSEARPRFRDRRWWFW